MSRIRIDGDQGSINWNSFLRSPAPYLLALLGLSGCAGVFGDEQESSDQPQQVEVVVVTATPNASELLPSPSPSPTMSPEPTATPPLPTATPDATIVPSPTSSGLTFAELSAAFPTAASTDADPHLMIENDQIQPSDHLRMLLKFGQLVNASDFLNNEELARKIERDYWALRYLLGDLTIPTFDSQAALDEAAALTAPSAYPDLLVGEVPNVQGIEARIAYADKSEEIGQAARAIAQAHIQSGLSAAIDPDSPAINHLAAEILSRVGLTLNSEGNISLPDQVEAVFFANADDRYEQVITGQCVFLQPADESMNTEVVNPPFGLDLVEEEIDGDSQSNQGRFVLLVEFNDDGSVKDVRLVARHATTRYTVQTHNGEVLAVATDGDTIAIENCGTGGITILATAAPSPSPTPPPSNPGPNPTPEDHPDPTPNPTPEPTPVPNKAPDAGGGPTVENPPIPGQNGDLNGDGVVNSHDASENEAPDNGEVEGAEGAPKIVAERNIPGKEVKINLHQSISDQEIENLFNSIASGQTTSVEVTGQVDNFSYWTSTMLDHLVKALIKFGGKLFVLTPDGKTREIFLR